MSRLLLTNRLYRPPSMSGPGHERWVEAREAPSAVPLAPDQGEGGRRNPAPGQKRASRPFLAMGNGVNSNRKLPTGRAAVA
jgi:hypothetical protein